MAFHCLLYRRLRPTEPVLGLQPAVLALPHVNAANNYRNGTVAAATSSINSSIPSSTDDSTTWPTEPEIEMAPPRQKGPIRVSVLI
jgi:hypothetical protein